MTTDPSAERPALLTIVWAAAVAIYAGCVVAVIVRSTSMDHPAAGLLALVVGAAAITPLGLAARRRDGAALADPLVLAGYAFWLPMFCLGGVAMALGWNQPFYLDLLADPGRALAAAELWALVGFGAFALGTALPRLRFWGRRAGSRLSPTDWPTSTLRLPAIALVVGGLAVSGVALATGRLGYEAATRQAVSPVPAYLQVIALLGGALLWSDLLGPPSPSRRRLVLTVAGLGLAAVVAAGFAESRAVLATWVLAILLITAVAGATRAGVTVPMRLAVAVVAVASVALFVGALVGSSYREVRAERSVAVASGDTAVGAQGRWQDIGTAFDRIGERGGANLAYVRDRSVQRLEEPGALAVVVARQRELGGIDQATGAPRVVASTVGSFVPRVLWRNKPATSDPGAISRLYFTYPDNAYAITPMGDLLRDLGPLAVAPAMVLMGAVLRLLHAALIESGIDGAPVGAGRLAAYVTLMVRAPSWWEGFYATFLADLVRAGVVIAVAFLFVHLWVRTAARVRTNQRDAPMAPDAVSP